MVFDITKEQFSKEVEHEAKMNKVSETPYIDSIIKVLQKYSMDESQASKLISKPILEKIQSENLNYNIIRTKKSKLLFT
jgi:5,10-methylene-tetrahydrofolate dehydrogenase/methenyl tetrahydrofolate cyclohydrolase